MATENKVTPEQEVQKKGSVMKIVLIVLAVLLVIFLACGIGAFFLAKNVYEENSEQFEEIRQELEQEIVY